jgi:hypothetical protein
MHCGAMYQGQFSTTVISKKHAAWSSNSCRECVEKRDEYDHVQLLSRQFFTALLCFEPAGMGVEARAQGFIRANPAIWGIGFGEKDLANCARRAAAVLLRYAELREKADAIQARADAEIAALMPDAKRPPREVLDAMEIIHKHHAEPLLLFDQLDQAEAAD